MRAAIELPKRYPRSLADEIARCLQNPPPPPDRDPRDVTGLLAREPGFALFLAYLDRVCPSAAVRRTANKHLRRAMNGIEKVPDRPFFSYGFAGAAWAYEHLSGWFVERGEDLLADIDDALVDILESTPAWPFDLQRGAVGFGVYAVERLPHPSATRLLARVIEHLEASAEATDRGVTWRTRSGWIVTDADTVDRMVLQGVLYGVAGVIGILGAAIHHRVHEDRARSLLERALSDLWAQRQRDGMFPVPPAAQLTWSAGSLGVATVSYMAARAAGLVTWADAALDVARRLAVRPRGGTRVRDASLAFGAAGAQHMFHRLYRATGETAFAEATTEWTRRLLNRRRIGRGLAGFASYSPVGQRRLLKDPSYPVGWIGVPGFANGIAGIGLVQLSLVHGIEPAWDRALLLSHREASEWGDPVETAGPSAARSP